MFDLVTDCLVFIGFLVFAFCFGFSGVLLFVPVHVVRREERHNPATTSHFFLIASGAWLVVRA